VAFLGQKEKKSKSCYDAAGTQTLKKDGYQICKGEKGLIAVRVS